MKISLLRYLGPNDIVIGGIADAVEFSVYPPPRVIYRVLRRAPWILLRAVRSRRSFWGGIDAVNKRYYETLLGPGPDHPPASAVARAFKNEWARYFKFCVIRNPWEKTVSDYFWRTRKLATRPSFTEYVRALKRGDSLGGIIPQNHSNWEMYSIDGRVAVDAVIRYENLIEELRSALASIGIEWDAWLPKAKAGVPMRKGRLSYKEMYTEELASIVSDTYAEEVELGGYRF